MTFIHNYEYRDMFPKMEHVSIDGVRYYPVDDELFPSSTSVTSFGKDTKIIEWW